MEKQKTKYRILNKIKNIIFVIIFVVLAIVVAFTIITRISGGTPSVGGYSVFRVSSGSMSPALEVGDVILVRDCDPMDLKKGDIVTYNGTTGNLAGKIVTHRVIKEPFRKGGEYYIKTQGDANMLADPDVNVNQVRGAVQCTIPILNVMYNIFLTPYGLLIIIALIILAFFNEIINFFKALTGVGYEDEKQTSVEDIIARYQQKNKENETKSSQDKDASEENNK